jgi:hypothetical protein
MLRPFLFAPSRAAAKNGLVVVAGYEENHPFGVHLRDYAGDGNADQIARRRTPMFILVLLK